MTDEIEVVEVVETRQSGQDLGNPNPPSVIYVPEEGHKSDPDSWKRTKDKNYLKKRARQLVNNGATDKVLLDIIRPRRAI